MQKSIDINITKNLLKAHLDTYFYDLAAFFNLAIQLTQTISKFHESGIILKKLSSESILVSDDKNSINIFSNFSKNTNSFPSPEQLGLINCPIDHRTDLFLLGVLFHELLTKNLPVYTIENIIKLNFEANKTIPLVLTSIIEKLLSRYPEDRYPSATGLLADLKQCLNQFTKTGKIPFFYYGQNDRPVKLVFNDYLYGRSIEEKLCLDFYKSIIPGRPELLLIKGLAGIGKTAFVTKTLKPIAKENGFYIYGKFDQISNTPYKPIIEALRDLIIKILLDDDNQMDYWKKTINDALYPSAEVLIKLVPELEILIGKQPKVPDVNPEQAKNRFQLIFQQFISIFAKKEHPLIIFLDDLQWIDQESADIIKLLLNDHPTPNLLIISAYRPEECSSEHILIKLINELTEKRTILKSIELSDLSKSSLYDILYDLFKCSEKETDFLTDLIYKKANGNPFFIKLLISDLVNNQHINFDYTQNKWKWEKDKLKLVSISDNVASFMVEHIHNLPTNTKNTLQYAACLGNVFELKDLAFILDTTTENAELDLWKAVQQELIAPIKENKTYKFLHDKIQQAAYSLIQNKSLKQTHLKTGWKLYELAQQKDKPYKIFDIANHINIGWEMIASKQEKIKAARINLDAGLNAKQNAAFESALNYFTMGTKFVEAKDWEENYHLSFDLYLGLGESFYLNGEFEDSEHIFKSILKKAKNNKLIVYKYLIIIYTHFGFPEKAIKICIQALKENNIHFPKIHSPSIFIYFFWEYLKLFFSPISNNISMLSNKSYIEDKNSIKIFDIINHSVTAAYQIKKEYVPLIILKLLSLSFKYGNTNTTPCILCYSGVLFFHALKKHKLSNKLWIKAFQIQDRINNKKQLTNYYFLKGVYYSPYFTNFEDAFNNIELCLDASFKEGDILNSSFALASKILFHYFKGDTLEKVHKEIDNVISYIQRFSEQSAYNAILNILYIIDLLEHNKPIIPEKQVLDQLNTHPMKLPLHLFYTLKMQINYLLNRNQDNIKLSLSAKKLTAAAWGMFQTSEVNFYESLTYLKLFHKQNFMNKIKSKIIINKNQKQMKIWAKYCPENFEHKYFLVEAERASVKKKYKKAGLLYNQAIESAGKNGFIQNEAIANECAGEFYLGIGDEVKGKDYLRKARDGYLKWGATVKVDKIEEKHTDLLRMK